VDNTGEKFGACSVQQSLSSDRVAAPKKLHLNQQQGTAITVQVDGTEPNILPTIEYVDARNALIGCVAQLIAVRHC
jgi:hypothetical protein